MKTQFPEQKRNRSAGKGRDGFVDRLRSSRSGRTGEDNGAPFYNLQRPTSGGYKFSKSERFSKTPLHEVLFRLYCFLSEL